MFMNICMYMTYEHFEVCMRIHDFETSCDGQVRLQSFLGGVSVHGDTKGNKLNQIN